MKYDLVIRNGTAVIPRADLADVDIGVRGGKVAALLDRGERAESTHEIDASGKLVFPGAIDPHMHIGLASGNGEWLTETRAAAIGGITAGYTFLMSGASYFPMIEEAVEQARANSYINIGIHVVPSAPVHLEELHEYRRRHGIRSFKYFTSFRGDEGVYLNVQGTDDGFLFQYLTLVSQMDGGVACVHPENIEVVWHLRKQLQKSGRHDLKAWDDSRPQFVEAEAAHRVALFAQATGCPVYLVHCSGGMVLDELRPFKVPGKRSPVYVETCPHYLTYTSDAPIGSLGKINPPLRAQADVEALWAGIAEGLVDTVGSDHVARQRADKQGSIWTAKAGFPCSPNIVPILLSEGVHKRGLSLTRVAELTSMNPARIFGVYPRKGTVAVGSDADFTIVDLDKEQTLTPQMLTSRCDFSLFEGWKIKGWPVATVIGGEVVVQDGSVVGAQGHKQYLQGAETKQL